MSLQPVNQEQVQQTAQVLLAFLSDESVSVPGNMLEGIVSGKSILRGIIQGQLLVCQNVPSEAVVAKDEEPKAQEDEEVPTAEAA